MSKVKEYIVKAQGIAYVVTKVRARSKAEAIRVAKAKPDGEWKQHSYAIDLIDHHVLDDGKAGQP